MPDSTPGPTTLLPSALDERRVLRALFVAYPDAVIVADAQGRIVLSNPAAARMLGYAPDELPGLSIEALVPDAIRPRHAAFRQAYAKSPRPRPMGTQMELVARRKDGSEVMVEIALSPLQDLGLPLVVASIRDIGSYPRVQQALQRARYSEHLAQLGRLAVNTRDPQSLVEALPQTAADALRLEMAVVFLLETDRSEIRVAGGVGLHADEAVGRRLPNRADTPAGFVIEQGRPVIVEDYRTEKRFRVPPGYLAAGFTSALAVPLSDRGRIIGAITVRSREPQRFGADEVRFMEALSNLLATSLQRAQSEEALNHAQRLESVGQLTGGIAHDFNNLLTVIQGNLQVLEELPSIADDAYGQQLVGAAMRASRRGAELTSKLLAFSRRQMLQPTTVDLHQMLHSLADMLARTLDQRIRIEVALDEGSSAVLADAGQLEAALLNIAINARDAMPEGGQLRFTTQRCDGLPAEVLTEIGDPSVRPDTYVALAVSDTGAGMTEEVKERAFEPFFTTKDAGRGTGLGLSTVYGFVKQSRGALTICSAPGEGTTLTMFLPRPWQPEAPEAEDTEGATVPAGLRVLLVEDDAEVRAVVRNFLQALQCTVTVASSGEQALLLLGPDSGYDLLLTDIALGAGMRGTELAAHVRQRRPEVAVLLTSGFSAELIDADRESPPDWELLRKPYSREELARTIARVMSLRR